MAAAAAAEGGSLDNIETRFGVELEICVRADGSPGCGPSFPPGTDLYSLDNVSKFDYYFTNYIRPSLIKHYPLEFPVRFAVKPSDWTDEAIVYTVQEDGTHTTETINPLIDYEIPFFYNDFTIICGDSDADNMAKTLNERSGKPLAPGKSFRFECVTPILKFRGAVTPAKVTMALQPYLILFGLTKPGCFMANSSAGYHVNVSLANATTGEVLPITRGTSPIFKKFVELYVAQEASLYPHVRSRRPIPKMGNADYESAWAQRLYKHYTPEQLANPEAMSDALKQKQGAIKLKKDIEVIEFRLFQSETDIYKLLEYAETSIRFLHDAVMQSGSAGGARRKRKIETSRRYNKTQRARNHVFRNKAIHVRHSSRRRR